MAWLTCVRALTGLQLYIETEDGQAAELDVHAFIDGLDELRDPILFARVSISELGELIWKTNRDIIDPDSVREMLAVGEPYALILHEPKIT